MQLLIAAAPGRLHAQTVVPDSLADRHVGEVVTVEGLIRDVHVSDRHRTINFNFSEPYPERTFSATVPDSAFERFPDAARWGMKRARVTGRVWLQDGRTPAVTLSDTAALQQAP